MKKGLSPSIIIHYIGGVEDRKEEDVSRSRKLKLKVKVKVVELELDIPVSAICAGLLSGVLLESVRAFCWSKLMTNGVGLGYRSGTRR